MGQYNLLTFHSDNLVLKQNRYVLLFLFVIHIRFLNQPHMKKSIRLLLGILFLASCAEAQIKKGTILLGGGISAGIGKQQTNTDQNKSDGISIYPAIGWATRDNTVIGVKGGYESNNQHVNQSTQFYDAYSVGLFLRRYLGLGKNFYLFGEASANYFHQKYKSAPIPDYGNKSISNGASLNFFPGIAYAVNKRIHLEVALNSLVNFSMGKSRLEYYSNGVNSLSKSWNAQFSSNLSTNAPLSVGFRFVLGK
jgi:hypothetical protein